MILTIANAHPYPQTPAMEPPPNPLTTVAWTAAYWAGDPAWATPGDGNPVGSWRDAAGGHPLTAAGTARPTFRAAVPNLNGQPGVEFDGTTDVMTAAIGAIIQPYTLVLIAEVLPININNTPCVLDSMGTGRAALFINGGGGSWTFFPNGPAMGNGSAGAGRWAFRILANNATSELNRNMISVKASIGTTTGFEGLTLGNAFNLLNPANLSVGFMGVYEGDLTTDPAWPTLISTIGYLYRMTLG